MPVCYIDDHGREHFVVPNLPAASTAAEFSLPASSEVSAEPAIDVYYEVEVTGALSAWTVDAAGHRRLVLDVPDGGWRSVHRRRFGGPVENPVYALSARRTRTSAHIDGHSQGRRRSQ